MLKIPFIVCILILLSGCGAKGELFLVEPKSEQTAETTEMSSKIETQEVEPKPESDQTRLNNPSSSLEQPRK